MARFTTGMRSLSKGERYEANYNSARINLLIAMVFTLVNCVLSVVGGNTYFLFSITFPYAMVTEGAFWTGIMFSPEEYAELGVPASEMMPMWFLFVMLVPAVIALALYALCWIFSKKRVGWMIAATVLFVIDTLFLILYYGVAADFIMDYLFHGWVLFILIRGVISHFRLKEVKAQADEVSGQAFVPVPDQYSAPEAVNQETVPAQEGETVEAVAQDPVPASNNSPVLHMADFSAKNRVLLQEQVQGYDICYRRVGKVNELVVNSMVYDLLDTGVAEFPHELCCVLDGQEIKAGFSADSHSYITFDGEVVKKKLRLM